MVSEAKRKRLEALSGRLIQSGKPVRSRYAVQLAAAALSDLAVLGPLQSTHKRLRGAQSSADQSPSAAWPYAKLQEEDFPAAVRPTSKVWVAKCVTEPTVFESGSSLHVAITQSRKYPCNFTELCIK